MEVIGTYEETVLQAELEVLLLRRKVEIIQAAINRRETVDLEAIEAQLELEKQQQMTELEQADLTLNELPQLTEQQAYTIQRQYREITATFHPMMNPNITEIQKELYQKAVEAYKMQDVAAVNLIHDMLFSPVDKDAVGVTSIDSAPTAEKQRADFRAIATELSTDYLLAKKLYACFAPLEEDAFILDMLQRYDTQRKEVEDEIAQIRAGFPFHAMSTLNDQAKTEDYLAELRIRTRHSESEKAELEKRIAIMMEGRANG